MKKIALSTLLLSLFLSGCAKDLTPGNYNSDEVGKINKVAPGIILSKRPIAISTKKSDNPTDQATVSMKRSHGYEYIVKLDDGEIVSIAQDEDLKLKVKQHVLVIYGNNTRVVADEAND